MGNKLIKQETERLINIIKSDKTVLINNTDKKLLITCGKKGEIEPNLIKILSPATEHMAQYSVCDRIIIEPSNNIIIIQEME